MLHHHRFIDILCEIRILWYCSRDFWSYSCESPGLELGVLNMKRAYMPSCIRPEVSLTPDQRILCSDVNKCFKANSVSLLVFYTA